MSAYWSPFGRNPKPTRKKRREGVTAYLSKMMEELAGYQNVAIGVKKDGQRGKAQEDAAQFHQPEMADRQQCYDLWTLKQFTLLVRSNTDGFMKHKDPSAGVDRIFKVSLVPKVEFQPEHGAEVLRADELRAYYWNSFLKRCKLHVIVRLHHLLEQALAVETILPSNFLSKDIYSARHQWISDGFNRLHWILQQLSDLAEGAYLLTREPSLLNSFSLYSESSAFEGASIHLLDESRKRIGINVLKPESAWLRIDPNVFLQWHVIRKHAPAAFDPKETSRGITPLARVKQKVAPAKFRKHKRGALQKRIAKRYREGGDYDSVAELPPKMGTGSPVGSDVID